MATGTIKRLVSDKGFGFVRSDSSTVEYFFHRQDCPGYDSLKEGHRVTFEPGEGPKGPRASKVEAA